MRTLMIALLSLVVTRSGWADGGTIRFQGIAGPFCVTLFTLPPVLQAGTIDVTALVQDRSNLNPLLDANVTFDLVPQSPTLPSNAAWLPPACAMNPPAQLRGIAASTHHGENRLLYGAYLQIPSSGAWNLTVHVTRGPVCQNISIALQIAPASPPAFAYWQLFLLPPVCILGFAINRSVRCRNRPAALY